MSGDFAQALGEARSVLYVCSGNMVRSAFAHLYSDHLGFPLPLLSAATTYRNEHIFPETVQALRGRGVDDGAIRAFRPTHLEDLEPGATEWTLVLAMTRTHLAALDRQPALAGRAFLLGEVDGRGDEIADPVLEGADFGRTFRRVAACVEVLRERLAVPG